MDCKHLYFVLINGGLQCVICSKTPAEIKKPILEDKVGAALSVKSEFPARVKRMIKGKKAKKRRIQ